MDDISPHAATGPIIDPGLASLTLLLRFHGIAANGDQILHKFGTDKIGILEMLRCAKEYGLKAKSRLTTWSRLATTPLPAIAQLKDGSFVFVAKADAEKILLQVPNNQRPVLMKKEQFEEAWNGQLIMMTRRDSLLHLSGRFDIGWFLQAMQKYKHLLGEVLIASFFLQMFGLVSPLIFQVVIDKVLVHQNLSTLDVLMVALVGISIFEAVLSSCAPTCSRTPPTASTSSWARASSAICWPCRWPTSRPAAPAIRWPACASSRTSATSSPARR